MSIYGSASDENNNNALVFATPTLNAARSQTIDASALGIRVLKRHRSVHHCPCDWKPYASTRLTLRRPRFGLPCQAETLQSGYWTMALDYGAGFVEQLASVSGREAITF